MNRARTEQKRTSKGARGLLDLVTTLRGMHKDYGDALDAADLTATLQGPGPFTVFVPKNPSSLRSLFDPVNKTILGRILNYEVVNDNHPLASFPRSFTTLNGLQLSVRQQGGDTWVGDVKITKADILCSNGIIHETDAILVPKSRFEWQITGPDDPVVGCHPSGGIEYRIDYVAENAQLLHILWNKVVLEHWPTTSPPVERTAIDDSPDAPEGKSPKQVRKSNLTVPF